MNRKPPDELIIAHLVTLKNAGNYCPLRIEVQQYLKDIGFDNPSAYVDRLVFDKTIIPLRNGRITLNMVKRNKKRRH